MARVNQIIIDYNQKMVINDETDIHKLTTVDQQSTAHTLFIRRINHGNSELIVINIWMAMEFLTIVIYRENFSAKSANPAIRS